MVRCGIVKSSVCILSLVCVCVGYVCACLN